jgi:hypothetical protein
MDVGEIQQAGKQALDVAAIQERAARRAMATWLPGQPTTYTQSTSTDLQQILLNRQQILNQGAMKQ